MVQSARLTVPLEPEAKTQAAKIGEKATTSEPFAPTTRFVRIIADAPCHVIFGVTPVATDACPRLPADRPEFFGVGGSIKLSVIRMEMNDERQCS